MKQRPRVLSRFQNALDLLITAWADIYAVIIQRLLFIIKICCDE